MKVIFNKNNRAKRYIIKIKEDGLVIVTIPRFGNEKQAYIFLQEHKDSIQQKIKEKESVNFKYGKIYKTHFHQFSIHPPINEKTNARLLNHHLKINADVDQPEKLKSYLLLLLKKEAKFYLHQRVQHWCNQFNLSYNGLKINSAKTRWGSCSSSNHINLSAYLMILPKVLIDYIILHELAHTKHKNHSQNFYQLLNFWVNGQHLKLNQTLKNYHPEIRPEYFEIVNLDA
ncbi:MAG: DUF45 domain-containing protein [Bacteroidales bacterium]|nr:DUF45 domain-containing protein [Bacteroidales bacterium]